MRRLGGLVSLWLLCSCSSSRVQVLSSLTPVDPSRPFFVYKPVKGTACGDDAIANAMEDLYRVAGDSHGFVSATIEQQLSGDRCVTITARPISYGCTANEPKKLDVYPMHVVPGALECAAAVDACTPDCTRFGAALASPRRSKRWSWSRSTTATRRAWCGSSAATG